MRTIYFTAEWCGPCKQLKPLIMKSGKAIEYVDVDMSRHLASTYNVTSVPTILILNGDGAIVNRYNGSAQIMEFLNR